MSVAPPPLGDNAAFNPAFPSDGGSIFFDDLLERAVDVLPAGASRLFVAVVGLDRFARLRARIGYALASGVVRQLARRIAEALPQARLGRLGRTSIELAFVAAGTADAESILYGLQALLERGIEIDGSPLELTVTIGYADSTGNWCDGSELIEQAEFALGHAQAAHQKLALFSEEDSAHATDRLALARDLRAAYDNDQLSLVYQPKLGARSEIVASVEALMRWQHPTRGMVPPDTFIAIAEDTGEIRRLTEWAITRGIADRAWLRDAGFPVVIYVNVSGRLLSDGTFRDWALATLRDTEGIGFELTETAVIDDPAGALANLRAYAAAGIPIAIDDYGSGWSSLAYLKELPAIELKIDKMFISGLASSHRDPLIVRSTIDLAHALDMEVTAEGVEDYATLALLRAMGCDHIQGYLISRPLAREALRAFLADLAALGPSDSAPWARPTNWFARSS